MLDATLARMDADSLARVPLLTVACDVGVGADITLAIAGRFAVVV